MLSLIVLCAALAGCVAPQGSASDRVRLRDGQVLAAPQGFCVDPSSRRDEAQGSFVLFGSCAAISGDPSAARPAQPAMLSATVGPQAAGSLSDTFAEFESFFQSPAGRAALARSGAPEDVRILRAERRGDLLLLKIRDRSQAREAPVSATYWRAITGLEGRITALSVLPLANAAMSDAQQIAVLEAFNAATRAANRQAPRR